MSRRTFNDRRPSTIVRDNQVHEYYQEIINELGEFHYAVSRGFIYDRIQDKTGLSTRTIAFILNHTTPAKISEL